MTDKYTVYFRGSITTETPFANSPAGRRGPNGEQLLPRIPVNIGGAFVETPFISAATIKGKVRRAAARVIADRFIAENEAITFNDWLLWALGGVKGNAGEDTDPRTRAGIIGRSALLSVFGAGDSPARSMVGASFHIGSAIPELEVKPAMREGARAHESRSPTLLDVLADGEWDTVNAYNAANRDRAQLRAQAKALEAAVKKAAAIKAKGETPPEDPDVLRLQLDEIRRLEAEAEQAQSIVSSNSIGRPLAGYEVLPPKLEMPHAMQLMLQPPAYIGFALEALAEFAIDPIVGAHVADGCGRISARYDVSIRRGRERQVEIVGRVSYGTLDGLTVEGEWLAGCRAAWAEAPFVPDDYRAAA